MTTPFSPHPAGRSRSTSAVTGSAVTHGIKKVWDVVWLLVVPLLVAVYVDMQTGDTWGSVPAFWLDDRPPAAGVAATLALLAAFAICMVLHRLRADLLLGVLPAAAAVVAHIGGQSSWVGAGVGLVVGVAVFVARRHRH